MVKGEAATRYEMIHSIVQKGSPHLPIQELCRMAGVSRSGYYAWLQTLERKALREAQDKEDFEKVLEAYRFRGFDKGSRGIHMRLLHKGIRMNRKKISRLMKKYGLNCPIRKANPHRRIVAAIRTDTTAPNLVNREFREHGPRMILLTDITYIKLRDSFVYLSVITDAYTKQCLSYVLSPSLEIDFVLETVEQLIDGYGDEIKTESLLHSDQGSHYTSVRFRELLSNSGLRQSMSRRGNCWDNAPQESFFGHMKDELSGKAKRWQSFRDVKNDIDDWMDYYNNDRYQWGLAKLSPNEYYVYVTTGIYPDGMCV